MHPAPAPSPYTQALSGVWQVVLGYFGSILVGNAAVYAYLLAVSEPDPLFILGHIVVTVVVLVPVVLGLVWLSRRTNRRLNTLAAGAPAWAVPLRVYLPVGLGLVGLFVVANLLHINDMEASFFKSVAFFAVLFLLWGGVAICLKGLIDTLRLAAVKPS